MRLADHLGRGREVELVLVSRHAKRQITFRQLRVERDGPLGRRARVRVADPVSVHTQRHAHFIAPGETRVSGCVVRVERDRLPVQGEGLVEILGGGPVREVPGCQERAVGLGVRRWRGVRDWRPEQ